MKNIFYNNRMVGIIFLLRNTKEKFYMTKLAKRTNYAEGQLINILKGFLKFKLITRERKGRRIYITLTKKGKEVADELIKIRNAIKNA